MNAAINLKRAVPDYTTDSLSLPDNVDGDKANASFKEGILKVTIPKTEKSNRKNIEIK